MMRMPIPKRIREQLIVDPFMWGCCLAGEDCEGRLQWHHHFTWAGQRRNEPWSILPLCEFHHSNISKPSFKKICDSAMINRIKELHGEEVFAQKYPKSSLLT